jgi:hypothetical protein
MRDGEKFYHFHTRLTARHLKRLREEKVRSGTPIERHIGKALDDYLTKLKSESEVADDRRRA